MKQVLTVTLLLIAFVMTASLAMAETDVTVTGEVRAREEMSDRSFDPDGKMQFYTFLRTRVNFEAKKDNNATAFIQFQDSRMFGDETFFGDWSSGTLNDGKNVDLHQAYIQIDKIWWDGFGGKIGRFEVNFGNQRVFGGVGWDNVGRSWEGGMNWYGNDKMKLTLFVLKKEEENRADGNADFDIYGLYYQCKKLNLDLFGVYEYDASTAVVDGLNQLDRMSFGLYYTRDCNQIDLTLNAVYQMGSMAPAGTDIDIAAYMMAFEAGYNFENKTDARLALGVDLTSGDDGTDDKINTYSGMYPTAHKFQGYMDYFIPPNIAGKAYEYAGLMDIYLKGKCDFTEGWSIGIDGHYFKTAEDYMGLTDMTSDVGMEFDVTVKTTSIAGAGIVWGLSYFMVEDDFADLVDAEAGFWGYMQTTVGF